VRVTENERGFCWAHRPDLAAEALESPGGGQFKAARRGVFMQKAYPDRKTCERILRLAGRTEAPPKPPRPRRRPRDRVYRR
jgi:hypothetical protein